MTNNTIYHITVLQSSVIIALENGAEICPTCMSLDSILNRPLLMANHTTSGLVIELIHMGSISSGLNTIGDPNITGSLILKIDGPMNIFPRVLIFLDLDRSIRTFSVSVAPCRPWL